jgi:serine/threonine-protein kinase
MGTIEVALEKSGTGFERIVALKRLHARGARDRRQTEQFVREARLAVWLVHPNVVHAFDFGESDGELFLAMEYVEGESLSAIVRATRERTGAPLPPEIVAAILADACEGLHAAHELRDPTSGAPLNVIHRDVSPHNVMVSYEGHVKLLDFGVAKVDSLDPLTRTGEVKGKTAYMSPEQAMGDPLDRRSDLFSLGVVLFECVSGRRMWGEGTDLDVMRKLALEAPPSLADAAPLAPRALIDLHARLVARSPKDRPATALAVAQELRAFAASSPEPTDVSTIANVMQALFPVEAAQRRKLLNEALQKAAPSERIEVLRRSLAGPTALAALGATTVHPRPSSRATVPEESAPASATPTEAPPATGKGIVVSALVGLVIATAVVAVGARHGAPAATAPPIPSAPMTPSALVTATPIATVTSTSTPTSTPTSTSTSTSTSTPTSPPTASASATPTSTPHRRRPKPTSSAAPLDVDPNPL